MRIFRIILSMVDASHGRRQNALRRLVFVFGRQAVRYGASPSVVAALLKANRDAAKAWATDAATKATGEGVSERVSESVNE